MRAFHFAWFSFFLAFTGWFALAPLIPVVRVSLGRCENGGWAEIATPRECVCATRCKGAIATANLVSVAGTIFMRLIVGSWVETHGSRLSQAFLVIVFSIPLALSGLVSSASGLAAARFFIGGMGATFVVTQYWTSMMFAPSVVGTANATSAGWGNLGGGFTQVFMPWVLSWFLGFGYDAAWRCAVVVPAAMLVLVGVLIPRMSDDMPRAAPRAEAAPAAAQSELARFGRAAREPRVWLLFVAYGGCFGTELAMNNVLAPYFFDYFGLSLQGAGLAASLFGAMNLFARPLGGLVSDSLSRRYGHRGRHWARFGSQLCVGLMLITFSRIGGTAVGPGLATMVVFSLCVQMAEGAQFAIVPFVGEHLRALGPVAGIVGAGGNFGAVMWSLIYARYAGDADARAPFLVHGYCVLATALVIPLIHFPELGSMFLAGQPKAKDVSGPTAVKC
jgi:NNP family nitrate/nitrite transporter-like MFS transporter